MSWIFRKIFRFGPFRTTLSKGGVGMSWGFRGFRVGVSPTGRKYISVGIPGTGIYFMKYLTSQSGQKNLPTENENQQTTFPMEENNQQQVQQQQQQQPIKKEKPRWRKE